MLAAAWVTVAFVSSFLSMFVVDRVSRPKMMAGGMIGCVAILITETILVARDKVGPGENKAALRAAVAMIFRELSLPLLSMSIYPVDFVAIVIPDQHLMLEYEC